MYTISRQATLSLDLMRAARTLLLVAVATSSQSQEPGWSTQATDVYPSVSPDGHRLVFQSSRLGASRLFVADTNGRNIRVLTGVPGHITPAWSPDGRHIAYAGTVDGQLEIFVADSSGANARRLTSSPAADMHPHWAADGSRIFFNSNRGPDGGTPLRTHDVFSMSVDGNDVRRHTDCRAVCTFPAPSPDGRRLVYRREVQGAGFNWDLSPSMTNSEIMISDLDGRNESNVSRNASFDGWPAWSPDGGWIVFASNRLGPANVGQIFAVRPDGTALRQLTSGPWSHAQPAFAPDGRRLYMFRLQEGSGFQYGFIGSLAFTAAAP